MSGYLIVPAVLFAAALIGLLGYRDDELGELARGVSELVALLTFAAAVLLVVIVSAHYFTS